jgi:hypothetical protein
MTLTPTKLEHRRPLRSGEYYWLAHSEGFRVESRDGRVGTVFGVHFDPETGSVLALRIRTGLLRERIEELPVEHVLRVDARRRVVEVLDDEAPDDHQLER